MTMNQDNPFGFALSNQQGKRIAQMGIVKRSEKDGEIVCEGSRWGATFREIGLPPHTEWEIAVHESGHALVMTALNKEFDFIELGSVDGAIKGGFAILNPAVNCDTKNGKQVIKDVVATIMTLAGGPIATSFLRYGKPYSWEHCGNDVVMIGLLEMEIFVEKDIKQYIEQVAEIVEHDWKILAAIATELLKRRRLTYAECREIRNKVDPTVEQRTINVFK